MLRSICAFVCPPLTRAAAAGICLLAVSSATFANSNEQTPPTPVWTANAAQWQSAATPPAEWKLESDFALKLVSIDDLAALRIDARPGSLSTLQIPYPSLIAYPYSVIEIRIGAVVEDGTGLHWFLKKGPFELRADNYGIFIANPADKTRVKIGEFKPDVLQTITLEYSLADRNIRSIRVDGVEAKGVTPYNASSLATAGTLSLFAATHSGSDPLFGGITVYTDASVIANAPRWLTPARAEEDPKQPPALPTWPVVENAMELELTLNPERLAHPKFTNGILFSPADFANLAEKIDSDPAMQEFWQSSTALVRRMLAQGQLSLPVEEASRMTYNITGLMPRLGLVYAATGNPEVGSLVRHLVFDMANRPTYFWVHSDLRTYDPAWPVGQLECAELARALSLTVQWTEDLFSAEELEHVRTMIRQKGLDPSLRWIETRGRVQKNNYLAVIGGGALIAAIAEQDKEAEELAIMALQNWLSLVEPDGSYGEPQGYFEYGFSRFMFGWWALGHERGKELLQSSPLRGSLDWMVYYFIKAEHKDTVSAWRVNFGDDDFLTGPHGRTTFLRLTSESLAYIYNDGLGTWISKNLIHPSTRMNLYEFLFRISKAGSELPKPLSPEEKNLPLAHIFDNGVGFIRSGWNFENDTLFAIRSGGAALTGYSHDRPNRNAFVLFSRGDYLAIAPGRASYRSPIHRSFDIPTTSHNTIAINGSNQIRNRQAEFTGFEDTQDFVRISSEAKDSYADGIAEAVTRTVWYAKAMDAFVIEDTVRLSTAAVPSWHLLLSNFEDNSSLEQISPEQWKLSRPKASLTFSLQADRALDLTERKGYMHVGYSYFPGASHEGTEGSAVSLTWKPEENVRTMRYYALLLPSDTTSGDQVQTHSPAPQGALAAWTVQRAGATQKITLRENADGHIRLQLD